MPGSPLDPECAQVDLWCADPGAVYDSEWHRRSVACLNSGEVLSVSRFDREVDRRDRFVARVFVRFVLSQYAEVQPADWVFGRVNGRPFVVRPALARSLRFSVSHTSGMIVCAVVKDLALGVDVERLREVKSLLEIASVTCSTTELEALRSTDGADRSARFLRHWTLKEAYAKARWLGMELPFEAVSFCVEDSVRSLVEARLTQSVVGDHRDWHFLSLCPSDRHIAAVAVERCRDQDLRLAVFDGERLLHSVPLPQATGSIGSRREVAAAFSKGSAGWIRQGDLHSST